MFNIRAMKTKIQKAEGKLEALKGRAKRQVGAASGDRKTQIRGAAEELKGRAKQAIAGARETLASLRRKLPVGRDGR